MTKHEHRVNQWQEGLISALAIGGFLIIFSFAFGLTPGLPQKIGEFFTDLTGVVTPIINGNMVLLAPAHPNQHIEVYNAIFNFTVSIVFLQVILLLLRFFVHSPIGKIAETVGNLIFWSGATIANMFLQTGTLTGWFTFWASLIISAGLSLVTQFIIRIVAYRKNH